MNYVGNEPAPAGVILVGDTNPVGMFGWFHAVPNGSWLQLNGQIVSKVTYADLWAYAQGFLTADQVVNPGLYKDVGGGNFALPNISGLFIRGVGQVDVNHAAAALGVKQADTVGPATLPTVQFTIAGGAGSDLYRFQPGDPNPKTFQPTGTTETRPTNVAFVPCVKALKTILMPSSALLPQGMVILPTVALAGLFVDFAVPTTARRITLSIVGASLNGVSGPRVQLAAGGVLEVVGYGSGAVRGGGAGDLTGFNSVAGFEPAMPFSAAGIFHGAFNLTLADPATNTWVCTHALGQSDIAKGGTGGGSKSLAGPIDRVRLSTGNGVDVFDLGKVGLMYE